MGGKTIGAYIRGLKIPTTTVDRHNDLVDFFNEYKKDETVSLKELKDGYAAFLEGVCSPNFESTLNDPGFDTANSCCIFLRSQRSKDFDEDVDENGDIKRELGKMMADIWLALFTAGKTKGPSCGQLNLMHQFLNNDTDAYFESCTDEELGKFIDAMKIPLVRYGDGTDEEKKYASLLRDTLKDFFKRIPKDRYEPLQSLYFELFMYYKEQIPNMSSHMKKFMGYIISNMKGYVPKKVVANAKGKPQEIVIQGPEDIKKHLGMVKAMLMKDESSYKDHPAESTLEDLCKAAIDNNVLPELYGDFMELAQCFILKENTAEGADKLIDIFRIFILYKIPENKIKIDANMYNITADVINNIVTKIKRYNTPVDRFIKYCLEDVCIKYTTPTADDTNIFLHMTMNMLRTGRHIIVYSARYGFDRYTDNFKKLLIWKKFMPEAKALINLVGEMTCAKMQSDQNIKAENGDEADDDSEQTYSKVVDEYTKVMEELITELTNGKALGGVQEELITCLFNLFDTTRARIARAVVSDGLQFAKAPAGIIDRVLDKCDIILKDKDLVWNRDMIMTLYYLLEEIISSYNHNGKKVTDEQNAKFMSIYLTCLQGDNIDEQFYNSEDDDFMTIQGFIFTRNMISYFTLHSTSGTVSRCVPVIPDVFRWTKIAQDEDNTEVYKASISILDMMDVKGSQSLADSLPLILDWYLDPDQTTRVSGLVDQLYPLNPTAVHDRMSDILDGIDQMSSSDTSYVFALLYKVSDLHPEAFTDKHLATLFELCKDKDASEQNSILHIFGNFAHKKPKRLASNFSKLLDTKVFDQSTLMSRVNTIVYVAAGNEKLSQAAIDYFMKFVNDPDFLTASMVVAQLMGMAKSNNGYMQKYKPVFEKLQKTAAPKIQEYHRDLINILEGRSIEGVYDEIIQIREDVDQLDTKVDVTVKTVIQIGDKVVEHDGEIRDVKKDLEVLDERVDDVEEDLGETKVKVEEIDNKTMTNAPKWSRDLTKLMNPKVENDWRLLSSRLGYSNDDIRGWAQQNDPCMAMLSEWYATHKSSEANHAVLTALQEMNRLDGAAIVENAMKASEDVVEDEDFEYPSPPPIFLSYQWGVQEEVKLLKHHLNMAGYECWMDIGQMGGGDKLFSKIDNGIRAAKVIICCTTDKYSQSPNCNREVNLSVSLGKPIIPLLMEKMDWPPKGAMGPIFSEYLFIRFFQRGGEETTDQRYWPIAKFQELLMQLNFFVAPDEKLIKKEYKNWWSPIVEEIKIDKNKGKSKTVAQSNTAQQGQPNTDESPVVFLSYQWGKQPQIKVLYQRLTSLGFTVWMDIHQMGGGDSLYDKIDRGLRGCKAVVSCVTPKYSLSANCRREISLADALKKPIIPLLLEQMKWPPDGPMSMVFTELIFINFYRDREVQMVWQGDKFNELLAKLQDNIPELKAKESTSEKSDESTEDYRDKGRSYKFPQDDSMSKSKTDKSPGKSNVTGGRAGADSAKGRNGNDKSTTESKTTTANKVNNKTNLTSTPKKAVMPSKQKERNPAVAEQNNDVANTPKTTEKSTPIKPTSAATPRTKPQTTAQQRTKEQQNTHSSSKSSNEAVKSNSQEKTNSRPASNSSTKPGNNSRSNSKDHTSTQPVSKQTTGGNSNATVDPPPSKSCVLL